jgi:hypothetical protein
MIFLGVDTAASARTAVCDTVTEIIKSGSRPDGLPYKAAHHLYQLEHGRITHDEAWMAIQNAIEMMLKEGQLIAPVNQHDVWKLDCPKQ